MNSVNPNISSNSVAARPMDQGAGARPANDFQLDQSRNPTASGPAAEPAGEGLGRTLCGPWKRLEELKARILNLANTPAADSSTRSDAPYLLQAEAASGVTEGGSGVDLASFRKHNTELLLLQNDMHSCTLEIDLITKLAEQGTSSTRQVLQTQA